MKFAQFILEQREMNSAAIIKDALDNTGLGLDLIRQTQTKENTSTSVYKENGHSVNAIWAMEEGPMEGEGYSLADAEEKLTNLVNAFQKLGGVISNNGSIKNKKNVIIKFNEFSINIIPIEVNSSLDGNGFNRLYLKLEVK